MRATLNTLRFYPNERSSDLSTKLNWLMQLLREQGLIFPGMATREELEGKADAAMTNEVSMTAGAAIRTAEQQAIVRDWFKDHVAIRVKPRVGITALLRATTSRKGWV